MIKSNSRLALYLFLMDDYFENGIYTKDQIIEEINGNGEINWNQTVNKDSVFIDNNIPYYYELITRKRLSDERNYVKQIHEVILTLISQELNEIQFLDLFDLTDIYLSERNLSDFGNNDLIIYNLEKALNEEFNTRKRSVILALIAYLNQKNRINDINCITIYGTNSFNLIWEDVCQVIFNNQLDYPLEFLTLPIPLKKHFNKSETLKELIEKPFWKITGNYAQETFIPDIVNIQKFDENYYFLIFDAKYYTARLIPGKIPRKQPGIESVSKQFLYQLAFKEFIKEHKFNFVKNFFILPSEGNIVIDKEQVKMDIMNGINLEDIEIRLIPAKLAYFLYLKDQKFNLNDLGITEREN